MINRQVSPQRCQAGAEAEAEAAIELPPLSPEDRDEALSKPTVTENDVAAVVSAWTKVGSCDR